MRATKKLVSKTVKKIAKSVAKNSVGKSYTIYGYEKKIPEEVEKWVLGVRNSERTEQSSVVHKNDS